MGTYFDVWREAEEEREAESSRVKDGVLTVGMEWVAWREEEEETEEDSNCAFLIDTK